VDERSGWIFIPENNGEKKNQTNRRKSCLSWKMRMAEAIRNGLSKVMNSTDFKQEDTPEDFNSHVFP
jgi:hypothetical protein